MKENLHTTGSMIVPSTNYKKLRELHHERKLAYPPGFYYCREQTSQSKRNLSSIIIKQSQLWHVIRRFIGDAHYLMVCRYD
jgi:hypothetical protein